MSQRSDYPAGVPCWVEHLCDDPDGARAFYGAVLGWNWNGPGAMGGDASAPYWVGLLGGDEVAGVAVAPDGVGSQWMTQVAVVDVAATARAVQDAGGTVVAGPMEVAPAGELVVFTDPAGAAVVGFAPGARTGAQRVNEPGAWAISVLSTPDPEGAAAFYSAVFGWTTESYGPVTLFRLPGYVGGEPGQPVPRDVVAGMIGVEDGPARWDVDLWVGDVDHAVGTATELGGEVLVPVHDEPMFRRATIADPAGARVTLSQLAVGPGAPS